MANLQLTSNLYKYRKSRGYTQEKLSQQLSISRQAYSNYETGKRDPDLDLLIRLCGIYSITLDQLVHQPFNSRNYIIREQKTAYTTATETDTDNHLYLTKEETSFLMKFREAEKEKRYVIAQILDNK